MFFFFNLEKPCACLNLICLYVYRPSRWHTSELICLVKNGKWFRRNLWERSDLMTFLLMFRGQNLSLSVSFFLRWSIVNKYFKLLYSLWLSMRLWFLKISFFFLWAGRGRENKNFVLSYGIWYRTTLRGPPYPVVCFRWGFHVLSNSNKILVREIDEGNSRVSQAKSVLTMVKLKSVLIFGIFQSINIVLLGPQNLVSATFPDDLGLHLSLM